jgi:hypothetical protein
MRRILIRSAKDPFLALTPEATLARNSFAGNTGNMLFTQSVHEVLSVPEVEVVSNGYVNDRVDPTPEMVARINEEYDAFVIPLANAFRGTFLSELRRLTSLIRQLEIPVVVVGVGAQTAASAVELPPEVREDTAAFLRAVLDRSAKVGVRGEVTQRCLAALGFGDEHIEVIGCPSLYSRGRNAPVQKRVEALTPESPIAANVTLTQSRMGSILERAARDYPRLTYVAQTRVELAQLLWGQPVPGDFDPTMPTTPDHPLYTADRIRMFVDPHTWHTFLGRHEFAFGTRLHGNIAAVVAGTPAYLLTFDSRTTEVARHHGLPHARLGSVEADVDPAALYERADFSEFNTRQPELFDAYTGFLEKNDLAHVHQPGHENPGFVERLDEVSFPGPVGTLYAGGDDTVRMLLDRLRWLHQGDRADRARGQGAYDPQPFGPLASAGDAAEGSAGQGTTSDRAKRVARRVLGRGEEPV